MGQADKISSQLFGPTKQSQCILPAVGACAANRRFFGYADAAQEDCPSVQKNLCSLRLNITKANLIKNTIGFSFDCDFIKLGIVGRPKGYAGVEMNTGKPIRIRSERLTDSRFRNSDGYFLGKLGAVKFHPTVDLILRAFL